MKIVDDSEHFSIAENSFGNLVAPGKDFELDIIFVPKSKMDYTARLILSEQDSDAVQTVVKLVGKGVG